MSIQLAAATLSLTKDTLEFVDEHPGLPQDLAWKAFLTSPAGVGLLTMKYGLGGEQGKKFYNNFRAKFKKLLGDATYRAREKRKLAESSANLSQSAASFEQTLEAEKERNSPTVVQRKKRGVMK